MAKAINVTPLRPDVINYLFAASPLRFSSQNITVSVYLLGTFAAGIAGGYDYSFSNTSDPQQAARFKVRQFGFYAGDQWRLAPNFTLTYGARLDIPNFPDKPNSNPVAVANFGYATEVAPSPKMFSPRAGRFAKNLRQGKAMILVEFLEQRNDGRDVRRERRSNGN